MIKNTLLKVITISILISCLFLTSCTTEEKTITVQDDMQKMSNELDEDGRIFTKVRDLDIPEIENISIVSILNDSSPIFARNFTDDLENTYADVFTLNPDNSINSIENSLDVIDGYVNNGALTYFKGTELWSYDIKTKEKKLIIDIPDIKELGSSSSFSPHKVYGENDYLSILSFTIQDHLPKCIIRILNMKTGEIHKSPILNMLFAPRHIFYSDINKKFYIGESQNIWEFSFDDINPKKILSFPGIGVHNFKLSEDGNYIYFTQTDNSNGELSLSRFNLINKQITSLLKISPDEKDYSLSWGDLDIVNNTIIYSFINQSANISYASQESKLYAANISEDSLTNTQLIYNTPKGGISALGFYLSEDGSKLLTSATVFSPPEGDTSKSSIISTQNSIYEKSK